MSYGKKIKVKCHRCGYVWFTGSAIQGYGKHYKKLFATCPNCRTKTKVRDIV